MVPRMEIRGWRQLETAASPKSSAQSMFAELQLQLITLIISSTILQFLLSHGVLITDVAISGCYIASSNILLKLLWAAMGIKVAVMQDGAGARPVVEVVAEVAGEARRTPTSQRRPR